MIDWLFQQTLLLTVVCGLLLASSSLLKRFVGSHRLYSLWVVIPALLAINSIPAANVYQGEIQKLAVTINKVSGEIQSHVWDYQNSLLLIWAVGLIVLAGAFAFTHLSYVKQLGMKSNKAKQEALPQQLPMKTSFSNSINSPAIFGLFRPQLVLPDDFAARFTTQQQQLMLDHEQKHFERKDLFWNVLAQAIVLLFWFNPIVWLAYKQFRNSQEVACDHYVLRGCAKSVRVAYAKAMVMCAEQQPRMFVSVLNYGDKKDMKERLSLLKSEKSLPMWRWLAVAASLLVAGFGFNMATAGTAKGDYEVKPVMRVEPLYPVEAAKQGIEGSVVLSYDINTNGEVENAKVIVAKPEKIFGKEAVKALNQWRYEKPSRKLTDLRVQLDFKLSAEPIETANVDGKQEQILVIE